MHQTMNYLNYKAPKLGRPHSFTLFEDKLCCFFKALLLA